VPSLNPDAIQMLDRTREVHVATPAKPLPTWAVVVDAMVTPEVVATTLRLVRAQD
jgi:hypothetical protein